MERAHNYNKLILKTLMCGDDPSESVNMSNGKVMVSRLLYNHRILTTGTLHHQQLVDILESCKLIDMATPGRMPKSHARKRAYRIRVICNECDKEIDLDYKREHIKRAHPGKNVKFSPLLQDSQSQIKGFFAATTTSSTLSSESTVATDEDIEGINEPATHNDSKRPKTTCTTMAVETDQTPSTSSSTTEVMSVSLPDVDHVQSTLVSVNTANAPMDVSAAEDVILANPDPDPNNVTEINDQDDENSDDSDSEDENPCLPVNISSSTLQGCEASLGPNHPILKEYRPLKFGNETSTRDFKPEWFVSHPWLSYEIDAGHAVCYPCRTFMNTNNFVFSNWKKNSRLKKHSRSKIHTLAMTKWLMSETNKRQDTSIMKQLNNAHKDQVMRNRQYLQVIVQTLMFTAQQNIAQRGHDEDRSHLGDPSDTNRGNFLELLHLRCEDIPWLQEKLRNQLNHHAQWTSPMVQNELLQIISELVLHRIVDEARASEQYSVIIDETSDISRLEQVAICLRFVFEGHTKEAFVGFHSTKSTSGEALFELVKYAISKLNLRLEDIVGQCYDGAANMSGVNKGLASRMKEVSPLAIYVHCYGHILNLAIQDTLTEIVPLRNTLGIIQSLYNFLEASPKRHALFMDVTVEDEDKSKLLTLKSLSATRWSCRWEAVKAVIEELTRIVKALLVLADDRDAKTFSDANSLLNSICDFEFLLGLTILKIILSNTSALSSYLQGKTIDVISARRNAAMTMKTLNECRTDESFDNVWELANNLAAIIKDEIEDTRFDFKEARLPTRRPSRRLQALMGEDSGTENSTPATAKDHHRVTTYFASLDKVFTEMSTRFSDRDQDILCALGDVVLGSSPADDSSKRISSYYRLDADLLASERAIFQDFVKTNLTPKFKTAASLVDYMHENTLHVMLPRYYQIAKTLSAIPATSCSAERSFSALRQLKTYLRSTMGQDRLSSMAIINIERAYANMVMQHDMDIIIDTFGRRNQRDKHFF